eukprot:g19639.t1
MRLQREYQEILRDATWQQTNGIRVEVVEDNSPWEWHVTFSPRAGNYRGLRNLHMVFLFCERYPERAPKVSLSTYLPHSNIIPDFRGRAGDHLLCTDILQNFFWTGASQYAQHTVRGVGRTAHNFSGWNPAYSAQSLLVQVQSFLFDDWVLDFSGRFKHTLWDRVLEEGGGRRSQDEVVRKLYAAQADAANFNCARCRLLAPVDDVVCSDDEERIRARPVLRRDDADDHGEDAQLDRMPGVALEGDVIAVVLVQPSSGVRTRVQVQERARSIPLSGEPELVNAKNYVLEVCLFVVEGVNYPVGAGRGANNMFKKMTLAIRPLDADHAIHLACSSASSRCQRTNTARSSADEDVPAWKVGLSPEPTIARVPLTFLLGEDDSEDEEVSNAKKKPAVHYTADAEFEARAARPESSAGNDAAPCCSGSQRTVEVQVPVEKAITTNTAAETSSSSQDDDEPAPAFLFEVIPSLDYLCPEELEDRDAAAELRLAAGPPGSGLELPTELLVEHVFPFLTHGDLRATVAPVSAAAQRLVEEHLSLVFEKPQLACFYTKERPPLVSTRMNSRNTALMSDNNYPAELAPAPLQTRQLLGFGVQLSGTGYRDRQQAECVFDFLSHEAFYDLHVRRAPLGQAIDLWFPLALDRSHFAAALPLLRSHVLPVVWRVMRTQLDCTSNRFGAAGVLGKMTYAGLFRNTTSSTEKGRGEQYEALHRAAPGDRIDGAEIERTLQVVIKLMNSLIVHLMKGDATASEKVLAGYLSFHQLLLLLCEKYPLLKQQIECLLRNFVENTSSFSPSWARRRAARRAASGIDRFRSKKHVPDLGEFLCLLSVSDVYGWEDVGLAVFEESAVRSIKWLCEGANGLHNLDSEKIFKGTVVGRRLLMFHCWFLNNVARKPHTHQSSARTAATSSSSTASISISKILCTKASCCLPVYERTKGLPSPKLVSELQKQVKEITSAHKIDTWTKFFARIGLRFSAKNGQQINLNPDHETSVSVIDSRTSIADAILAFYKESEEKSERLQYHISEEKKNALRERNLIRRILHDARVGVGGKDGKRKGKAGRQK